MLGWAVATLREYPVLAAFLAVGVGWWIGNLKLGRLSLGPVPGVLLAGLMIGQLGITVSADVKTAFFLMFLFAMGYGVGPQFVRSVASDGVPQAIFAILIAVFCALWALACAHVGGLVGDHLGFGAGLFAGSQGIAAAIGMSTQAINDLGLTDDTTRTLLAQVSVAYAVTVLWGSAGAALITAQLGPILIKADLEQACKDYAARLGATPERDFQLAWHQLQVRAYRIDPGSAIVGKTVAEAEALHSRGARIFVERIQRGSQLVDAEPTTVLQAGDIVALSGPTEILVESIEPKATEVAERELLTIPVESVNIVVTRKPFDGKTLEDLAREDFARGVYLNEILRGPTGVSVPILPKTAIHRGDILKIAGTRRHTDRLIQELGYADRPSPVVDVTIMGLAIFFGALLGTVTVRISGIPLTLGTAGGALIAGLAVGWLRSVYPAYGRIPGPTVWFMNNVGLTMFIAVVGIDSAPAFASGLQTAGPTLLVTGFVATTIPLLLAPLIGKYIFGFHPAINLGCCSGARHSASAAAMVVRVANSQIPMLGYSVAYAISNTLHTIWGLGIVLMLSR